MMFKVWTEVRTNIKKSPLFQVLMYASFLKDDFCNKKLSQELYLLNHLKMILFLLR